MTSPFSSAGTTIVPLSSNPLINGLLNHNLIRWGSGNGASLTYSFPWSSSTTAMWDNNYGRELTATQYFGFNQTQIASATAALQAWSDIANITFTYTADTATNVGDFRFAFSSAVDPSWGWCYYPNNYYANAADVWVTPDVANEDWSLGSYNFFSLMHEIGHGLGLQHPFNEAITLPSNLDVRNYTIMSYTDPGNVLFWDGSEFQYSIKTPMVYDILAIQYLYGANNSFHTGNDVYHFSASEGTFETIWDAGGVDTIDISQFTTNCSINLTPGSYSSLPLTNWSVKDNIGIAFGAVIENAIGGSGNDTLTGNSANNTLDGRLGTDTVVVGYSFGSAYSATGTATHLHLVGAEGDDWLDNIEYVTFAGGVTKTTNEVLGANLVGSLTINDVTITEGNSGTTTATYVVTRSGGTAAFSVNYTTTNGTATTADNDYAFTSGTLSFETNVNTQTISVTINGDTKFEADESFSVALSGATNGTIISDGTGVCTIVNDDVVQKPDFDIHYTPTLSSYSVTQGSNVTISYFVDNLGAGIAGASTSGIYRSTDNSITTSDTLLATDAVATIAAAAWSYETATFSTSGWAPGTYFIGAIADYGNTIAESNETNNSSPGISLTVTAGGTVDDYSDSLTDMSAPRGAATVGVLTGGQIETAGDTDIFAISLTAGRTYTFDLARSGSSSISDPVLRLLNGAGVQLAFNDDFGGTFDSHIDFVAPSSGIYFLEASCFDSSSVDLGHYLLKSTSSGRDVFFDTSSANTIDGGAGLDTVVYAGRRAGFDISVGAGSITVNGTGADTIANVERIQFTDSIVAFDIQGNAGNAYRLYQAAFNRTPDTAGLSYWTHALDQGVDILTVARGFVQSSEFRSVYGVQPSNASIVDHLYHNVLHRAGDPEGVAFWTRGLENGLPIADLLQGFAVSSENHSLVDPKIAQGIVLDTSAYLV